MKQLADMETSFRLEFMRVQTNNTNIAGTIETPHAKALEKKRLTTLVAVFLLLLAVIPCQAANISESISLEKKGVVVGLDFASLYGDDAAAAGGYEKEGRIGATLGGFATFRINKKYLVRPELLYIQKGAVYRGQVVITYKFNYFELPLLYVHEIPFRNYHFEVFGGPYISGLYEAEGVAQENGATYTADISNTTKAFDYGIHLGGGVRIQDNITIGLRLSGGAHKFDETSPTPYDWRHYVMMLGASISY